MQGSQSLRTISLISINFQSVQVTTGFFHGDDGDGGDEVSVLLLAATARSASA